MMRQNLCVVFLVLLAMICLFYLADGSSERVLVAFGGSGAVITAVFLRAIFTTNRWFRDLLGRPCQLSSLPEGRYEVLAQAKDRSDHAGPKWEDVMLVQAHGHSEERIFAVFCRHDIHVAAGEHFEINAPTREKTIKQCFAATIYLEDPIAA